MFLPTLNIEKSLWKKGHKYVCGIDEVGRGSWAGPLVVGAVILPQNFKIPKGLADSKMVSPKLRKELSQIILKTALSTNIIKINSTHLDQVGLAKATHIAFRKVARTIEPKPDFCIIDAFYIKHFLKEKQMPVKNGDKISASIAAASIIAKVYRDNLMEKLHTSYPQYGFAKHKGYGTLFHRNAIKKYGLSSIHRTSYNLSSYI